MKTQKDFSLIIEPHAVEQVRNWIATRGGVAVWSNKDLSSSSLGSKSLTPALTEAGSPMGSPNWRCGNSGPDMIVTDAASVGVRSWREVSRVKIRRGPPYLGGVNRADRDRLDQALEKAGEGATWESNYDSVKYGSAWFDAVILVPSEVSALEPEKVTV